MRKQKPYVRLTIEQRVKLVVEINSRESSAVKCSKILKVTRQTIYDEIKLHREYQDPKHYYDIPPCMHSKTCAIAGRKKTQCTLQTCPHYEARVCPLLKKFPFVCNKCPKVHNCQLDKYYYDPNSSHDTAKALRVNARVKDYENDPHVEYVNSLLSPIIQNRNSLHHAYVVHAAKMPVCERTVRRWLYRNALDVKAHQLPMWGKYLHTRGENPRPSRVKATNYAIIAHRMFKDYLEYKKENPLLEAFETDSVIGKRSDHKALLTIHLPSCNFMFGYVINKGSALSVLNVYRKLRTLLGHDDFQKMFPLIICDNGSETQKLWKLETHENGEESGTRIFYCDTYSAYQRPTSERNHTYVRRVLLKGQSLNNLTDAFVQNMFSQINAIPRESLQNKTPYSLFHDKYGALILRKLGIAYVSPLDVNLLEARRFK